MALTPDDGVVPVQPHGNRLAVEDHFPEVLIDETLPHFIGRRPVPALFPGVRQPADFPGRDGNGPLLSFDVLLPINPKSTKMAAPMTRKWTRGSRKNFIFVSYLPFRTTCE